MGPPNFFEGPEKKLELVVAERFGSLRQVDPERWHAVVRAAGAEVLSHIHNDHCDAYLLSESSLFVFDDHVTMITCGLSQLVEGLKAMLDVVPAADVVLLFYERKNEFFPERQPTTFREDARVLARLLPGHALRFGGSDAPHLNLFCTARPYQPDAGDVTLEILMHHLDEDVAPRFRRLHPDPASKTSGSGTWAERLGITGILPGFQVDEHVFEPTGYSVNALRDDRYYTVHVTPERPGSYVSFETNVDFRDHPEDLVARVTEVFRPRSVIVVAFTPDGLPTLRVPGMELLDRVESVQGGYQVSFTSWYRLDPRPRAPAPLDL